MLLLLRNLIFTCTSCSAANVFSHLDFRTDLMLRSFFRGFLGGWMGVIGNVALATQLDLHFMWRHSLGNVNPKKFLDLLCQEFAKRDNWI